MILRSILGAGGNLGSSECWINTLGGTGSDSGNSVTIDSSGNIIVCGATSSVGSGGTDLLLVKYNSSGNLLWQKTLGGEANEYGNSVTTDSSDNIIVCGDTTSTIGQSVIIKYNSSGTLIWKNKIAIGINGNYANAVVTDSLDNIIIFGFTYQGGVNFITVKYNSSGTLLWQKTLGNTGANIGYGITIDSANNIIVCGGSNSYDGFLGKYNSNGALLWQKTLGGAAYDLGLSVTVDSSGDIIVCGYTDSVGAGGNDIFVGKYNSIGQLLWQKIIGGAGNDLGKSVTVDSSRNIIVCGYTSSVGSGGTDLLLVKYNSNGALLWQKTLGGAGNEYGNSVTIDSSGNIIVCGSTSSVGSGGNDLLLVKYNSDFVEDGTYGVFVLQPSTLTNITSALTQTTTAYTSSSQTTVTSNPALTETISSLTETFRRL